MKYLRMTMWFGRTAEPMTTVIPETSLQIPIHSAATQQRALMQAQGLPGPVIEVEVHELEDGLGEREAILKIIASRPTPLSVEEHCKLTVFDWAVDLLSQLNPGGTAQTTRPAPLAVADLRDILDRVAKTPGYKDQRINMVASDLTSVCLVNGKVVVGTDA